MSVIFEGMEMPTACCFVDGEHSAFAHFEFCRFYTICKQRETVKTNYKPSDCPVKALEQEPRIITCKECKYYRSKGNKYSYCTKRLNVDSVTDRYREPNFYCADAVLREVEV